MTEGFLERTEIQNIFIMDFYHHDVITPYLHNQTWDSYSESPDKGEMITFKLSVSVVDGDEKQRSIRQPVASSLET